MFISTLFFSPVFLEHLELQQTYACSTVWCNRKNLLPYVSNKLRRAGEVAQAQKANTVFTKWYDISS